MSRAAILFLLWAMTEGFAQGDPQTFQIDLQLGRNDPPDMLLVELSGIGTGIVFQRQAYTATCPTTRPGDFALKKVNPKPGFAISEHIGMICTRIDTVTLDTTLVYEVNTPRGELYYMQMIELMGQKVKVRLTTTKPSAVQPKRAGVTPASEGGEAFGADGRKQAGSQEAREAGARGPTFYRAGGASGTPSQTGKARE